MNEAMFGYDDSLSFTELSKGVLDTFKNQYNNVYAKGMLISMCLDLELLHLSNGKYGLMNLIQDLSKSYGKDRAFKDEDLIPKIVSLTYPVEIKAFFDNYVIGGRPLPFEEVLGYAGVNYTRIDREMSFSFGQCDLGYDPSTKKMVVTGTEKMNDFGKALGYEVGDEIDKINGKKINPMEFRAFRQQWIKNVKEGDKLKIAVIRKNPTGKNVNKTLKAKVFKAEVRFYNTIEFNPKSTEQQLKIRNAWLDGVR
jgi:predicted metalloprotease with PDZ domain